MSTKQLDSASVGSYLKRHGVFAAGASVDAESLGGGVSNVVLRAATESDCVVVKQPLANLAVEQDWPADRSRVHNEAAAARGYGAILSAVDDLPVRVPSVRFEDKEAHVIALDCAPSASVTWKRRLLGGEVRRPVAETLARFLAASHVRAAGDETLREEFTHAEPFEQLRVDPYHRTIAERHPDVAETVETEIARLTGTTQTLVHGDFSPKNVLVGSDPADPLWVLDFEVAHWGDPAFDVAFMLNHLFIKAVNVGGGDPDRRAPYLDAASTFWRTYNRRVDWSLEHDVVRELGVLMLARVDGKSPVEYVTESETKKTLRTVAKRSLLESLGTVEEFAALLTEVDG